MKQMFMFFYVVLFPIIFQSDQRKKNNSKMSLNENNKCVFRYLYTLIFTVNSFIVVYCCTQVSNMEATVNKEFVNYMKQIFKFSITVHFKIFCQFDERIKRDSEIFLNKINTFLFTQLYTLTFTVHTIRHFMVLKVCIIALDLLI